MAKKLYVRFSTAADEQDIFDFYAENEHQFVFRRDPDIWRERISSGAVTLIQDEDGKIMASSISYPVTRTDENGVERHLWTEIGSTRVGMEGAGLFKHLLSAQVMRAFLLEPPEERFVLEIVAGNQHSKHVFLKNGATPFDIPDDLAAKVSASIAPENQGAQVQWFQIGPEAIPAFARHLVDTEKNSAIENKLTGEKYELDFSRCVLFTHFRDAVENAAGHDFGDTAKPDLQKNIGSIRKKFTP